MVLYSITLFVPSIQCLLKPEPCELTFFGENGKVRYSLDSYPFSEAINKDFELSSEFSRIRAIPHFTIFAKKS